MLHAFAFHFTNPTYVRFLTLAAAAVLTPGGGPSPTSSACSARSPRSPHHLPAGPAADRWPGLQLGCTLTRFLLDHVVPDGPVELAGDDTVDGHPGKRVYGKAWHRDAVRSSHSYTAWRYVHKWVVLAVLVKFPFATRRWALPVLVDLYRSPESNRAEGRRHKTPAQLMCHSVYCSAGSRIAGSCSPGIPSSVATPWPGSATATGTG